MIAFDSWSELLELEGILEESLLKELKDFYIEVVTEMLDEEDYKNHDMSDIGKIAVLEAEDDIENLPQIGLTEKTITILEAIPEFVELVDVAGELWYRCTIILSAATGVVVYVPEKLATGRLGVWIDTYKEEL